MGPNEIYAILMMIILIAAVFMGLPVALVMRLTGDPCRNPCLRSAIISYQVGR